MRLLTRGSENPKTAKLTDELGLESAILHLAPAAASGFNLCPFASPGCAAACLNTAGNGRFQPTQDARIRRARRFMTDRTYFLADLVHDVEALTKKAAKTGRTPAVRLNGTSDVAWERHPVTRDGVEHPHIFAAFPDVRFYDYTKAAPRLARCRDIPNYWLTFSLSESNDAHALNALRMGFNVAAVVRKAGPTFAGFPTIDGDEHDYRFLDPQGGYVVVLTPKGKAFADETGFVRAADAELRPGWKPTFAAQTDADARANRIKGA